MLHLSSIRLRKKHKKRRKKSSSAIILGLLSAAQGSLLRQMQFSMHSSQVRNGNVYITNDLLHIRIGLIGLLEACSDANLFFLFFSPFHRLVWFVFPRNMQSTIDGKVIFMP